MPDLILNLSSHIPFFLLPLSMVFLGIFSSLHCGIMCGPLFSLAKTSTTKNGFFIYHLGRLLAYLVAASLFSLIGTQLFQWSQSYPWLGLLAILLTLLLFWQSSRKIAKSELFFNLRKAAQNHITKNQKLRPFLFGLFSLLVPCSYFYLVLLLTFSFDFNYSLLLIAAFWFGTIPIFSYQSYLFSWIKNKVSHKSLNFMKAVVLGLALLMILARTQISVPENGEDVLCGAKVSTLPLND